MTDFETKHLSWDAWDELQRPAPATTDFDAVVESAVSRRGFLTGVVAFGCWFVRRSGSKEQFVAAGGSIPGWAVGLSIFGTYLSSNTFLGVPGKAF